ncbi:hypothetical protein IJM86_01990 [bacterium]|nr:hypothetical protein [bacterium]
MKEKDEADLVNRIKSEINEIKKNIDNQNTLKEKRDELSLRKIEGAITYLKTVKEKDIQ